MKFVRHLSPDEISAAIKGLPADDSLRRKVERAWDHDDKIVLTADEITRLGLDTDTGATT